jgi:hypothetical protein
MSSFFFNAFSHIGMEEVLKKEMRLTWVGVGDGNPQTPGWIDPQVDKIYDRSTVRRSKSM